MSLLLVLVRNNNTPPLANVLLKSSLLDLVGTLETIVNEIPSGGTLYENLKEMVPVYDDIPKAIDSWCSDKLQEVQAAAESVKTADTSGVNADEVEKARNSAEALQESAVQEINEARDIAKEWHENDEDE